MSLEMDTDENVIVIVKNEIDPLLADQPVVSLENMVEFVNETNAAGRSVDPLAELETSQVLQRYTSATVNTNGNNKETSNSLHYTRSEKLLLLNLVKQFSVIKCKKVDAATVHHKRLAWKHLAFRYNQRPEVTTHRSAAQLRLLWKSLKERKRHHVVLADTLQDKNQTVVQMPGQSADISKTDKKKITSLEEAQVKLLARKMKNDEELHQIKLRTARWEEKMAEQNFVIAFHKAEKARRDAESAKLSQHLLKQKIRPVSNGA